MGSSFKYPQKIMIDIENEDNQNIEQSWDKDSLNFIKSPENNSAITNKLSSKNNKLSKPRKLKCMDFGFDINENARIDTIEVGWVDKVEGIDNNIKNPPTIPGVSMELLNYPDGIIRSSKAKLGINYTKGDSGRSLWNTDGSQIFSPPTPEMINSSDFGIMVSYKKNISPNEGFILLDYLRLYIEWTDPRYSLNISSESKDAILNQEVVFTITLRNTNDIHQGKAIKVNIDYDEGLSFIKYTDEEGGEYDDVNKIWNAKLDPAGKATLFLKFSTEKLGILECSAKTELTRLRSDKVNVANPKFQIQTKFTNSTIEMIQGDTINYTLIAISNSSLFPKKDINIQIPKEIAIKGFKCDGDYDKYSGIWSAEFRNNKAYLHLCITPNTIGDFIQRIIIDEETILEKTFSIVKGNLMDVNYSSGKILPSGLQYLEDSNNSQYLYDKKTVIKAKNITMKFELNPEKIDNFKEYFIKAIKRDIKNQEFLALDDVSFELEKGDRLGLIGLNGAGKSTLLKIIAGVMKPTKGKLSVSGKIAPLLELGAGFDPNYTGKENIFLNGSILGYSKEFIEERYEEIAEFSELGRFLDVPIKNYSSGMKSKLGFSIATIVNPDILILDEVLSVGDAKFRKKSGDKIKSLFESGVTVLLVSHSINQVRDLCNKAIWLEKGKIIMSGNAKDVCDAYEETVS